MNNYISEISDREYSVKIKQYFIRGWEIFEEYTWGFIGFSIITILFSTIVSQVPALLGSKEDWVGDIFDFILTPIFYTGIYIVALQIAKNKPKYFTDFFRGFNKFLQIFLVNFVGTIFILTGSLFLLIPGIYLAVAYTFSVLFVIEKKLNFWSALEASRKLITKKWFSFLGFVILLCLFNLFGFLVLGIGIFLTIPLTSCIIVAAFEDIVGLNGVDNNESDNINMAVE